MLELDRGSIYRLGSVNKELFFTDQSSGKIQNIEANIKETRKKLLNLMQELEKAKAQPVIQPISYETLESFFVRHPAMGIRIENGVISLISKNQCVAFHTSRGRNRVACNNDIIYVTLPLYGFRLDFHPNGRVSGSAIKSEIIREIVGEEARGFGHPHATKARSDSLAFQNICNGNNRFIQDWDDITLDNSLSGPTLMRLMSQAAVWMETANLSDMYGTFLAENVPHPDVPLSASEAMRLYTRQDMIGAPDFLKDVPGFFGLSLYKRCLYSIWLFRNYRQLAGIAGFKEALYEAIAADLLVMQADMFTDLIPCQFVVELQRTVDMAARCLEELGGYCPRGRDGAMSELCPEIFNMENDYA